MAFSGVICRNNYQQSSFLFFFSNTILVIKFFHISPFIFYVQLFYDFFVFISFCY